MDFVVIRSVTNFDVAEGCRRQNPEKAGRVRGSGCLELVDVTPVLLVVAISKRSRADIGQRGTIQVNI